jgi:hypothetical protein
LPAQQAAYELHRNPKAAIIALKQGTLVVRLPSNQRKIKALEASLDKAEPNTSRARWLEKELAYTRESTLEFNTNMVKALNEAYTFSGLRFTYDYFTPQIKTGQWEGIFLNEDLEVDPSIGPGEGQPFLLTFGRTQKEASDGIEAMVLMTNKLERFPKPFPYYQRLNDFEAFIGSLFPKDNQKEEDALRLVGKLDKKLNKYYNQASDEPQHSPKDDILALKQGHLVVCLPSNQDRIQALEAAVDEAAPDTSLVRSLEEELAYTREATLEFNTNMAKALNEAYTFSELRFTYDYFTPQIEAGQWEGIFLNEDLGVDPAIGPGEGQTFLLLFEKAQKETSVRIKAMELTSDQLERFAKPIPHYQRLNDFKAFIGSLFPKENQKEEDALRLVGKWDEKLNKFYDQVQAP